MAIVEDWTVSGALIQRSFEASSAIPAKVSLLLVDLMAAVLGLSAAAMVWPAGPDERLVTVMVLVFWSGFLFRARLYSARFITRRSDELRRIVDASILAGTAGAVVAFFFRLEVGRTWLVGATLLGAMALCVERDVVRRYYDRRRVEGRLARRVLLIGDNDESSALADMFRSQPELGYRVVDSIDPRPSASRNQLTTHVLAAARECNATGVIIAATAIDLTNSNRLARDLMEAGLHVELSSTLTDIDPGRLTVRPLGRFPIVYVEPIRRRGWRVAAKRAFDLVVATLGLVVTAPLVMAVAIAVRVDSPGPVIFRQVRVGQNGSAFDVFKFRTMVANAEQKLGDLDEENEGAGPLFKIKHDPRVTGVGRFLRKTSLDELPQLWNVIRDEMSLVGPRPALSSEMAAWDEDLYGRLRVKPGITGMWQVSGRSETSFEEYTRLDLYYVDNWSLIVDLAILARTIPAVLRSDGAY